MYGKGFMGKVKEDFAVESSGSIFLDSSSSRAQ